jgi:hypothetical protein
MANTTVGKIVYDAVINTDGLKKDAQVADKQAQAVGDSLGNKVAKGATIAGTAMVAVGATFMKVTADSLKATVEWAGGVAKLSRETGSGTEAISKLLYAGKRYGLEVTDMSKSLGIFSKKLVEANKGNNETADTFNKMGVSIKGADGKLKPFDSIFGQVAEKFKAMPNGVEKTALAMQLFGKSGKDMLPLLNQGADGMAKLGAQAEKFGFVLTQNNIKAFAGFRKATFESEQAAKGLQIQLGLLTLGPMTKLKTKTTELVSELNEMPAPMKEVIGTMIVFGGPALSMTGSLLAAGGSVAMLTSAFPALAAAIGPVGWVILGIVAASTAAYLIWRNWATLSKTFAPILQPIVNAFSAMFKVLREQLQPAIEWAIRNWDVIKKVLVVLLVVALIPVIAAITGLTIAFGIIIGITIAVIAVFSRLVGVVQWLYGGLVGAFNGMRGAVNSFVGSANAGLWSFISVVSSIPNRIRAVFNGAGSWLYSAGQNMVNGLISGIKDRIGGAISAIASAAGAIKDKFASVLKIRSPSKVFAQFGKNITQGLANGITNNLGVVSGSMGALTSATTMGVNPSMNAVEGVSVGQASSNKVTVNVDMSGIMARSKADEREIAKSLIARVNEELRSKGKPVIGGGAI